ncbi:FAD binding domain-containing protein [Nocardioides mangrovi]|uniref:FAD binding domain-containing protein n=1 Tax=Nocardioides mangrovi TaxID=2874580 RepID=A0ABS7UH03_9ACTN|nr:FAD binding domain-containing protein [Nocardioides mangrovi]MBZ5740057.1 FAD binding domain-containing protein [Nocardioides mangrovi]
MDLSSVTSLRAARSRADLTLGPGETVLAGGTWLFSEPQPTVTGLVDLTALGWPAWEELPDALRIGATCTIEQVQQAPWGPLTGLVREAADSFLMSWKVQHVATVGGNLCLGLPAGAMISLTAALGASVEIWTPAGEVRHEPVAGFVTGDGRTTLRPGEVLRAVDVPRAALAAPAAFRRTSLARLGRAGAVVIGSGSTVTVTASTSRPVALSVDDLEAGLAAIDCWFDDPHGAPDWRAHVTGLLAREVAAELVA